MSDIVFILGAGASRQCGGPLMYDFLDMASDLLVANNTRIKKDKFELIFECIGKLQVVHSKSQLDLNNIESIFTVLELGKTIKRVPGLEEGQIDEAISALKVLIVDTLQESIDFPLRGPHPLAPAPYDKFASLLSYLSKEALPARQCAVLTFNYDVAADLAMYRENLGPCYRIGETRYNNGMDLLKLHGSLNWAVDSSTKEILPFHLHDFFGHVRFNTFGELTSEKMPVDDYMPGFFSSRNQDPRNVEEEPLIVPPSWNKSDYHQALSDIWARAADHLSAAEYIFIIGYSLPETDSFFRHLFALGSVGSRTLRKLIVFNPDESGKTDARFRAMLGPGSLARYEYQPKKFAESIPIIKTLFPKSRRPG